MNPRAAWFNHQKFKSTIFSVTGGDPVQGRGGGGLGMIHHPSALRQPSDVRGSPTFSVRSWDSHVHYQVWPPLFSVLKKDLARLRESMNYFNNWVCQSTYQNVFFGGKCP